MPSSPGGRDTLESMEMLLKYAAELNYKLTQSRVLNGHGEEWLDANIPDWKSSVEDRVQVKDTRFGFPRVYPIFNEGPTLFGRRRK